MTAPLRIATRQSRLALWQARHVAQLLSQTCPDRATELVPLSTRGDEILDRSLAKVGGKGLFIKELENALLDERADFAVHSMKDMPAQITAGLEITAVLARANPFDAFVSNDFPDIDGLPENARVGTSSLRRASQLLAMRPDLQILPLRGNVETRLAKLDGGQYEAIVLAVAGLTRLGLEARIMATLTPRQCLPAIGQGVIGIECRSGDEPVISLLKALHDTDTWQAVQAERALGARLGGSCQSPIAGFAREDAEGLMLEARVLSPDGRRSAAGHVRISGITPQQAGTRLAEDLLAQGADAILAEADAMP